MTICKLLKYAVFTVAAFAATEVAAQSAGNGKRK